MLLPPQYQDEILLEYKEGKENIEKIVEELGPQFINMIKRDIDNLITNWKITGEKAITDIKQNLYIFCSKRASLFYHPIWATFATILVLFFSADDAYLFLTKIIKHVYPEDYFSPDNCFWAKNTQIRVLAKYIEKTSPLLVKSLTTKKKNFSDKYEGIIPPGQSPDNYVLNDSPFKAFSYAVGEAFLTNFFTYQIQAESFLKLLDIVLLEGFDFIHKLSIKVIQKMSSKLIRIITKTIKGKTPNEENLTTVGIVAASYLFQNIKKGTFLNLVKIVYTNKDLKVLIVDNKERFTYHSKISEKRNYRDVIHDRVHKILKARHELEKAQIALDDGFLASEFADFENLNVKTKNQLITYMTFYRLMTDPKKQRKWDYNQISTFLVAADPTYSGFIEPENFKMILALLSRIEHNAKMIKMCEIFDKNKNTSFEFEEALEMINAWEIIFLGDLKISKRFHKEILRRLRLLYSQNLNLTYAEFIKALAEIPELEPLIQIIEIIDEVKVSGDKSIQNEENLQKPEPIHNDEIGIYQDLDSPTDRSRNLSFSKELIDGELIDEDEDTPVKEFEEEKKQEDDSYLNHIIGDTYRGCNDNCSLF